MPVSATSMHDPVLGVADGHRDPVVAALAPVLALLLDRLDRVLDDVGQRLAELAAVADQQRRRLGRVEREGDVGMGDLVQEQGLARRSRRSPPRGRPAWACARRRRIRRPSACRSPTWRTIVPVSCSNVAGIGRDLLAVAPLQPLGGELDRGQRVLDLVGDAAGDVGPGGAALVEQLLGDVVEGEDVAALDLAPASPPASAARRPRRTG